MNIWSDIETEGRGEGRKRSEKSKAKSEPRRWELGNYVDGRRMHTLMYTGIHKQMQLGVFPPYDNVSPGASATCGDGAAGVGDCLSPYPPDAAPTGPSSAERREAGPLLTTPIHYGLTVSSKGQREAGVIFTNILCCH